MQNPVQTNSIFLSPGAGKFHTRAKYIPDPETGNLRLAMVQGFTFPMFNPDKDKLAQKRDGVPQEPSADGSADREVSLADVERASRRAKIAAFDKILCNPDLDTFATFTYAPGFVTDKADWDDCYQYLKNWLSNRVQRHGLKYVIVPERHKSGDIHFHGILNSQALHLERAISPKTGRPLSHQGNPLFNLTDWQGGFTSAEIIKGGREDRAKVAKYIFKYMGKQSGAKVGGRYMLSGGDLVLPTYVYDDGIEVFLGDQIPVYDRVVDLGERGQYMEYSFI
jgi:hypothetical protein